MAHAPFNLSLCLQVGERRMAHRVIQQELNILYTCSLSPSVSEKGTERTVSALTLGRAAGSFNSVCDCVEDCRT